MKVCTIYIALFIYTLQNSQRRFVNSGQICPNSNNNNESGQQQPAGQDSGGGGGSGTEGGSQTAEKTENEESKIKILTQDPGDPSKTKENDASQYDFKNENNLLEYKFKDGVKCLEIGYDNKQVWKYDSSQANSPNPERVIINVDSKTIIVSFKESMSIYRFESDNWKSTFSGKPEVVELNTKSKKDKDNWSYSKQDKVGIYTAKDGKFFFNVVKANTNEIWKTENKTEYATKVVVKVIGQKPKEVTIYLLNGTTRRFSKEGKNKPWTKMSKTDKGLIRHTIVVEKGNVDITLNLKETDTPASECENKIKYLDYPFKHMASYIFDDQVTAFKILHDGKTFTNDDANKDSNKVFPTSLHFDLETREIYLFRNEKVDLKGIVLKSGSTEQVYKEFTLEHNNLEYSDLKFMSSEKGDGSDKKEIDKSKYKLLIYPFSIVVLFEKGVKCTEIKVKDKVLWDFKNRFSEKNHPVSAIISLIQDHNVFIFPEFQLMNGKVNTNDSYTREFLKTNYNIMFFGKQGSDTSREIQSSDIEKEELSLLKNEPKNEEGVKPNENEGEPGQQKKEESKWESFVTEYTFKDGVKCTEVKFEGESVWKHKESDHKSLHPRKVVVNRNRSTITVEFNHLWYYSYAYLNQKWKLLCHQEDGKEKTITKPPRYYEPEELKETTSGTKTSGDGGTTGTGGTRASGGGGN